MHSPLSMHSRCADLLFWNRWIRLALQADAPARWQTLDAYYLILHGKVSDLELMARLAERAVELGKNDYDHFCLDMGYLTLLQRRPKTALLAGIWDRAKFLAVKHLKIKGLQSAYTRFGSEGFAADDGSNQVQHFWYFAAVAYDWGTGLAEALARYHELNLPGLLRWLPGTGMGKGTPMDLRLSLQAIELGRFLAERKIPLSRVGDWMRSELS